MKGYCVRDNEDCESCSLGSYGMDCMNIPIGEKGVWLVEELGSGDQVLNVWIVEAEDSRAE